ncbi:MAG: PrsW family glutamic-type intramembrane protease [Phycisphaeraceae bacterium]
MFVYIMVMLCAAAIVALVYRYDLYEREPWRMVFMSMTCGFIMMHAAGLIEEQLIRGFHIQRDQPFTKAMLVALVEDCGKLMLVFTFAIIFARHFNDPLDGLVYGTLIGLGAAINESLNYLRFLPHDSHTLGGEVIRLFAHAMMGGILGFGVGLEARPWRRPGPPSIIVVPALIVIFAVHVAWDWIAYQPARAAELRLVSMGLMMVMMTIWGAMVVGGMRRSKRVFHRHGLRNTLRADVIS